MTFHIMNLAVVNAWLEYRRDANRTSLSSLTCSTSLKESLRACQQLGRSHWHLRGEGLHFTIAGFKTPEDGRKQTYRGFKVHLCITKSRNCFRALHMRV
ncbi:hypothetical protein MRX96_057030 [Rhipicephalus microplus]